MHELVLHCDHGFDNRQQNIETKPTLHCIFQGMPLTLDIEQHHQKHPIARCRRITIRTRRYLNRMCFYLKIWIALYIPTIP